MIGYDIFFHNSKWYCMVISDTNELTKRQISEVKALTDIIMKAVDVLNEHEKETDKEFMGGIFDEEKNKKQ